MTFVSTNYNADEVKLNYINQTSGDSVNGLEAMLGGAVVEELDAQINMFSADLIAINTEKQLVRSDLNTITAMKTNPTDVDGVEVFILNDEDKSDLESLAESLGIDIEYTEDDSGNVGVSRAMLESVESALDNKLQDLNTSSEMKMISFQSLMDARKQAMMMLSNMISSDNQTKMAVIQNLKN